MQCCLVKDALKHLTHIAASAPKNTKKPVNNPVFINNFFQVKNNISDNQ
jgi:hypothetical protein